MCFDLKITEISKLPKSSLFGSLLVVEVGEVRTTATLHDAFRISLQQVGALAQLGLKNSGNAPGSDRLGA